MAKTKRKTGTRAGVPNQEYETVVERHAECPHCGDTRRQVVRKVGERTAQRGVDPWLGKPYTHVSKRIVRCDGCNRCYAVRTYENRKATR